MLLHIHLKSHISFPRRPEGLNFFTTITNKFLSKKMKTKILGISACLLIVVLDIIAMVLALKAKEAQNQVIYFLYY